MKLTIKEKYEVLDLLNQVYACTSWRVGKIYDPFSRKENEFVGDVSDKLDAIRSYLDLPKV